MKKQNHCLNYLKKQLKNSFLIGIDETTVQVLKEPGKPPESKSYMWAFRGGTPKNPIILFHYSPSRSGSVPYCQNESDYEKLLPMFVDRTKIKIYNLPK
ncbi:MAG: hypothetical protein A2Z98_11745 [Spirochaetes bacterium GWB1_27_13]|nr:MAG: hypothetical protein A2Z98_11745 [Spirochaetes bacterium GWB1_27_13]